MLAKAAKCGVRSTLPLIMVLAMLTFLTNPIQADSVPIDLELGGEGATSWSINNIQPGDTGTKTVTLHNAGYKDGLVTIWISDVISNEGLNPESETGDTTEPGELDNYLAFDLSCTRLSTNLSLPTTIDNLPQSASALNYIQINPLNAGETVDLEWLWELPLQTGNEVNGDNLSFTINYLLEELTSIPSGPADTPDENDDSTRLIKLDVLGKITWLETEADGTIIHSYVAADPKDSLTLEIDRGTKVICDDNKVPVRLELTTHNGVLPVPYGMVTTGPVYNFTAYINRTVSSPAKFNPPIRLTLNYDPDELPANTSTVFIAYYDKEQGLTELESPVGSVAEVGRAKAELTHLSLFSIVAKLTPPHRSANFEASNLTIDPIKAQVNQPVTISFVVTNSGGITGSCEIVLKIDDVVQAIRKITLGPKKSEVVNFEVSNLAPGKHQVKVAGLTGQFSVTTPASLPIEEMINWSLLGLIVVAIVVAVIITRSLVKARVDAKRAQKLEALNASTEIGES